QLNGVTTSKREMLFEDRMRNQIGKETNLSGLSSELMTEKEKKEYMESSLSLAALPGENRPDIFNNINRVIRSIEPYDLQGAIQGTYTKEEAEQWIKEYNEAMNK
ncbi:MAG: hypothetical protein AAGA66_15120, partial [Bacteroidota bacterium]